MIVLDTTVLVYAKGAEQQLREPCRRLIDAIREEEIEATMTVEVIQEFVHVTLAGGPATTPPGSAARQHSLRPTRPSMPSRG